MNREELSLPSLTGVTGILPLRVDASTDSAAWRRSVMESDQIPQPAKAIACHPVIAEQIKELLSSILTVATKLEQLQERVRSLEQPKITGYR